MDPLTDPAAGDLWVFGYGSLMWRPGFDFVERVDARLIGAHRALCVYSFVHRGTPERPGLVLGLDRGGACRGIAFRVAAAKRAETVAYLRAREQVTMVYREFVRPVRLKTNPERAVPALCYMVDRSHPQYAGRLDARPATASRAPGSREVRPQPRLCDRDRRRARSSSATARPSCICWRSGSRACTRRTAAQRRQPERAREPATASDPVLRKLALAFGDQPRGRGLDVLLQPRREFVLARGQAESDRGSRPRSCRDSAGTSGAARTARN